MSEENLEHLYEMRFLLAEMVARYLWIAAYPSLPEDEPEGLKRAREHLAYCDQQIARRVQEIKDRVQSKIPPFGMVP